MKRLTRYSSFVTRRANTRCHEFLEKLRPLAKTEKQLRAFAIAEKCVALFDEIIPSDWRRCLPGEARHWESIAYRALCVASRACDIRCGSPYNIGNNATGFVGYERACAKYGHIRKSCLRRGLTPPTPPTPYQFPGIL